MTRNTSTGGEARDVYENFWRTARKAARHVPFMEDVVAAYYCALDKRTPLRVKGILLAALGYFVLPADTIPDVLLGIGFTDDLAVLTAASRRPTRRRRATRCSSSEPARPDFSLKRSQILASFVALNWPQGRQTRGRRRLVAATNPGFCRAVHRLVTQINSK